MPKLYQYVAVWSDDNRNDIDTLEAKGNSLGLGPLECRRDIIRPKQKDQLPKFHKRHVAGRLFLELKKGDTIVFPAFDRAMRIGDFLWALKRWIAADIRVVVIDLGIDTASDFGRAWAAVALAMAAGDKKITARIAAANSRRQSERPSVARRLLGTVSRGPRSRRIMQVEPTMYELALKCRAWVSQGWTPDDIETHLWKNKVYRHLRYAPKAMPVEALKDPAFARKWEASSIKTLLRNLDKIDAGVLDGTIRLPREWRPSSGPLKDIPIVPRTGGPGCKPAPPAHWTKAAAIARKICDLMRSKGMRQKELVRILDMPQSQVSDLMRGSHMPNSLTIAKVAKALGVPVNTFDLRPAVPVHAGPSAPLYECSSHEPVAGETGSQGTNTDTPHEADRA